MLLLISFDSIFNWPFINIFPLIISLYTSNFVFNSLGFIVSIFVIKPNSANWSLNLLLGKIFSSKYKFLSFSISFKYLPKYDNSILYSFSSIFSIFFISKQEKGRNNTSFSFSENDNFSMSQWVNKLYSLFFSLSNIYITLDKLYFCKSILGVL